MRFAGGRFLALTRLPPETVFVMQGGGNFGDLYPHHQRLREAIIAAFPDRRIVVMPQSVLFKDDKRLQYSSRLAAQHPDLHVIARDRESLEVLASRMRLANCYLHIDAAFALQPIVTRLVEWLRLEPTQDELRLLRRDSEAGGAALELTGALDWASQDDLIKFADQGPEIDQIDIAREVLDTGYDAKSWRRLRAAVRLFSSARRIVDGSPSCAHSGVDDGQGERAL